MCDFDLIIIGAGIHGSAVARAAALDGYNVCIVEQYSEAARATSSRSSKLIHGGLRYLESNQFALVKECLRERHILLQTASSLVKLVPFYIPVYKNNSRPAWLIASGLFIYRLLGGGKFKKIAKAEWPTLDGLEIKNLQAVFQYYDALTDDKQLTQAILQSAIDHGASFRTDTKLLGAQIDNNVVSASFNNQPSVSAKIMINASGPWVNNVLANVTPSTDILPVDLVQGTHIIIPRTLSKGIYYIEASDKRVIFAIPWKQHCLVGTTETVFNDSPEKVRPLAKEMTYLLSTWNHYFNDNVTADDILQSFAGLRVLPASAASAFNRTRETILHCNDNTNPEIISIYGGKLTAHRATAEAVMSIVHRRLTGYKRTDTSRLRL